MASRGTRRQAAFFLESYDIDAVIQIDVDDQVVLDRVLNRRLCGRCGLDYNLIFHRPADPEVCDVCGGKLAARADDTPEAVRKRLQDYHDKTAPILELFSTKELIVSVDGSQSAADVQNEIRLKLGLEHRRNLRGRGGGAQGADEHGVREWRIQLRNGEERRASPPANCSPAIRATA